MRSLTAQFGDRMTSTIGVKRPHASETTDVERKSMPRKIVITTMRRWKVADAKAHPNGLFVFGDNLHKIGKAGQVCALIGTCLFIVISVPGCNQESAKRTRSTNEALPIDANAVVLLRRHFRR